MTQAQTIKTALDAIANGDSVQAIRLLTPLAVPKTKSLGSLKIGAPRWSEAATCILYNSDGSRLNAMDYFREAFAREFATGIKPGRFINSLEARFDREAARRKLERCACGHLPAEHERDELDNLLHCAGCDCDHFHYEVAEDADNPESEAA